MKMIHCIFHTSKGNWVGDIASRADYKQVAEAVIEDHSGLTRLSEQDRMNTSGACPEASLRRSETTLRDCVLPAANRALPAIRLAQISSAEGFGWLPACDE
jgi:hypothetical protein